MFQAFCVHMARLSSTGPQPSLIPTAEEVARLIEVVDVKIKSPNSPSVIVHFSKEPPPGNPE